MKRLWDIAFWLFILIALSAAGLIFLVQTSKAEEDCETAHAALIQTSIIKQCFYHEFTREGEKWIEDTKKGKITEKCLETAIEDIAEKFSALYLTARILAGTYENSDTDKEKEFAAEALDDAGDVWCKVQAEKYSRYVREK